MKYKSVAVTRLGPPDVLQVVEKELRPPAAGEVRIKVLAASVSRPDVTARRGEALYSGTPLGHRYNIPFIPGYSVVGNVDAVGEGVNEVALGDRVGALTVVGGYTEFIYWRSDRLIPVPAILRPAEAVTLILNYIVAYQTLHRKARIKAGETALIIGASGGIGTALLQLGKLAGIKIYGLAAGSKHRILAEYGAVPIDYKTQDYVTIVRRAEPGGIDVVLDGMMRLAYVRGGLSLLRQGGRLVSFGEPENISALVRILVAGMKVNLLPSGKSFKFYGTSTYFLGNKRPFLEDWATLFRLLQADKIKPVIAKTFSILDAAQANRLLESGTVTGNVVLLAPELL